MHTKAGMGFLNPCWMKEDTDLDNQSLSSLVCLNDSHRQGKGSNSSKIPMEGELKMLHWSLEMTKRVQSLEEFHRFDVCWVQEDHTASKWVLVHNLTGHIRKVNDLLRNPSRKAQMAN
jgi:hypothetical protein